MSSQTYEKAVLITGAGGGLGVPTAAAFAERGYLVYAGVRNPKAHPGLDRGGVRRVALDVTDQDSVASAIAGIAAERGDTGLQVLVNNAGVIVQGPLELVPDDELHRSFDVNVYGPARVTRAALPLLRAGSGRVINISAVTARAGVPFLGPLAASKAALESLSDALRVELAPWSIPVSIIEPGAMETSIFDKAEQAATEAFGLADPDRIALYRARIDAFTERQAKQRLRPVTGAVKAIVRVAQARRPKARYVIGPDARVGAIATKLPARLRDRALASALGLTKAKQEVPA